MNKQKFFDFLKIFVSLLLLVVSVIIFFTTYQQKKARSETLCDAGAIFKDEASPYEYKGNAIITEVGVKAGTACVFFKVNASTECYQISGLGTNNVTVKQIKSDDDCKGISHVSFYSNQTITPTSVPSNTPGPTNIPTPTNPAEPTVTPIPSVSPTISICPLPNPIKDIEVNCSSCTQ
ncbi:hypothetical protein A2954_00945 [Candidatus Roizmanbacteria bacterium RIFCSPLOWO2_01_FULL_37_12]|uniref:Uncharacterized protein n=1 Tax=Candidatus Roizmanbacteria bacterium RIFCSPLOWO2_01_FULL_37_12 TaxID=1802056 RepID=A0A1F7IGB6_9BACT|nr:MAG: hypothetical protein A3D76_06945 [Candidatus Roizmanbacteria bacterium RIFCSPHIGHO2_02_FULL_37_9b]OGK42395.1 MAG: hypothetical protein A2954_00945 [Candidatus Roizmanbacteria bacterium RIFCSPLOWO2_01_FULL_37_12]